ncbi:MAG: hypothetical protein LUO95_10645 [Methylococcaceae bacterium]|nr:hypothetical protein [Methylococcaceae bacterium]MDD1611018.1 hypothetical protein [Methylococcaceae bacterium]MDD1615822.1 hypothetical protein [Methylococcaceae bacterium]OYV19353.1 MAG: hypothetical protein CG439_931 [Methylococcaceae bacterium NSP1-2]
MKTTKLFWIFGLTIISTQVFAYGSSSSTKSCTKPHFSEFVPADKAQVAPQSTFSFTASAATNPKSIVVDIKKQPVAVTVTPKGQGYQVSGTLPSDLKATTARINITAESPSNCKGSDGWLINITD